MVRYRIKRQGSYTAGERTAEKIPGNLKTDRRSAVKGGAALIGTGLLGSFSSADPPDGMVAGNLFNVRKFGATGNRNEKATGALRNAVDACAAAGGGMVYIPPGDYTVGTIQLKDNVTLHIEAGATLFLSQDREDFIPGARTMIFAEHVKNISVTGKGTLDGLAQLEKGVNADGIDICSSRNVTVSDSVIITADDSIVLKTPLREGQEKAVIA